MPRRPDVTPDEIADFVRERWELTGRLTPLPGERDRNFLLEADHASYVVKAASPDEPGKALRFQTTLLRWLEDQRPTVPTPRVVPSRSGALIETLERGPQPVRVRIMRHLPGRTLAEAKPRTPALLRRIGALLGRLDTALAGFPGEAPPREGFDWALAEAPRVLREALAYVPAEGCRTILESLVAQWDEAADRIGALTPALIHGDANDHNILVGPPRLIDREVTGVLDFGDAHRAPRVFDPAIAVAYALLGEDDLLAAAAAVLAGYHEVAPLEEREVELVWLLARARLGASVSIAARRRAERVEMDDYLTVSEAPAWQALERARTLHPRFVSAALRAACGYGACPRSAALTAWLSHRENACARVVDIPPEETVVLDLSVGSPLLDGRDIHDTEAFTRRVFDRMRERGARMGIGRYDEPRAFYLTDAFSGPPGEPPERRTIHLGVDLFVAPGTEVRAPLDGVVYSVSDHAQRLDYGPTVILEHVGPEGPFWTLYGHLERHSVRALRPGTPLAAGVPFARVGPYPENGDWPPHLHFQIVTDLLDREDDFPGVAAPRERAVWTSFSPDPGAMLGFAGRTAYAPPPDLLPRRRRLLGPSLSVAYRQPIHVVRGIGAYLYDEVGRAYLDCVNNVAHVGHEHPRVVRAARDQMGVLNTNTRYLHEAVLRYAERLTALMPEPLSVCFFVNSGSEANELALRLARAHTGGRGVVVLDGAYHGNTQGLIDVSPYKFDGPGGEGAPSWVRVAPTPDEYRGLYRSEDPHRAERYAAHVAEACADLAASDVGLAAFLAESVLSCAGQIEPPPGFLSAAYARARAAGAVCIADEVQIGFGRLGEAFWGFELQGATPDIVTLGKPIGNGHPMGAVVTTRAIAESFATGMEFFSTFGGNPVSAVTGLAVLDVIEDEGLREHAAHVGEDLRAGLAALAARHPLVGDVRGRGLFLGVELVRDRDARTPAPEVTRYVVERARARRVLLSSDGPDHNVLKIKPPLCLSSADARRLVEVLDGVLDEDLVRDAVGA